MPSQSTSCSKEKKQPVLNCNKLKFVIQETFVSYRWKFYNIYISQGSVATPLRCDGICFITRLLPSPRVKKFWKSANGCRSYEQLSTGSVFPPNTVYSRLIWQERLVTLKSFGYSELLALAQLNTRLRTLWRDIYTHMWRGTDDNDKGHSHIRTHARANTHCMTRSS